MEILLIFLYAVLGYWATGKTIYAKKICVGMLSDIFMTRLILGVLFGFILIPIALVWQVLQM